MKRILIATITVFLSLMAANVQAGITIGPGAVELEIKPGQSSEATLNIAVVNLPVSMDLVVGEVVMRSRIKSSWLTPARATLVPSDRGLSSMKLKVTVPDGTDPGIYKATLPVQTSEQVDTTEAISLKVTVPRNCVGAPGFKNVEVGPKDIWAPKTEDVTITVSGTATNLTPGCEVTGSYTLPSNDGQKTGEFTVGSDGNFALKINGKFSKKGAGKDADLYKGELKLTDALGSYSTNVIFVEVAHDRRK